MKAVQEHLSLKWLSMLFLVGLAGLIVVSCSKPVELDEDFQKLLTYNFGDSREPLMVVQDRVRSSFGNAEERLNLELQLAELLKKPESTLACKDFACRQLMLAGTEKSVKAIATLLNDDKTADMARYALERNPDPSVDAELVKAAKTAKGRRLVGIINTLGERRNSANNAAIEAYVSDSDADVAAAAKTALAKAGK